MRGAMKVLNFTDQNQEELWKIVAIVLHLGNIEFGGMYVCMYVCMYVTKISWSYFYIVSTCLKYVIIHMHNYYTTSHCFIIQRWRSRIFPSLTCRTRHQLSWHPSFSGSLPKALRRPFAPRRPSLEGRPSSARSVQRRPGMCVTPLSRGSMVGCLCGLSTRSMRPSSNQRYVNLSRNDCSKQ